MQKRCKIPPTDLAIRALKPDTGYCWDATTPAFGLYVGKHRKTFVAVLNGGRRIKIGLYGDLSLQEARLRVKRRAILTPDRRPNLTPLDRELVSH